MRRVLALSLLFAALTATMLANASGAQASRIKGVVLNTTCAGPCGYPPPPPPRYTGPGLTVRVTRLRTGAVIATRHPDDGRFSVRVAPGRYRVRAWIESDASGCWRGSSKHAKAVAGETARMRLSVDNACIV
jgi:hypothetical protein